MSQKDVVFGVVSSLRGQGKSDTEILLVGPSILLDLFRRGEWKKEKGESSDSDVLRYSKDLLKNWMKKDPRLNGGEKYSPKTVRGSREKSGEVPVSQLRMILEYVREKDPTSPQIVELEEKIMWAEAGKAG